jgi:protocatechuate 3,4-dioxygenase beta subunit
MNAQRTVCLVVCSVVFLLGFSLPVRAQNVGSLHGTVVDPTGAAVPDANVTATDTSTDSSRTTKTDSTGSFNFAQVTPGTYRVEVEKTGFKVYLNGKVEVLVATPTSVDVALEVGTINQQVTVESAAAPALNTQDATLGNTYAQDQVQAFRSLRATWSTSSRCSPVWCSQVCPTPTNSRWARQTD